MTDQLDFTTKGELMDEYKQLLNNFSGLLDGIIKDHLQLVYSIEPVAKKRKLILDDYKKDKDNLFSSVFKYRLENFHSQMLRNILNPNTQEIGNRQYLKLFIDCLREIKPEIKEHVFEENTTVECEVGERIEDGRIDIFICDDTYGIIIENKINIAPDQPNQLAKYLRYAKRNNKDILAIVYIPLYNNHIPPIDEYDDEFKTYIEEIKNKLVILPGLDIKRNGKDIAHGFLEKCIHVAGNTEKQIFLLTQYSKLLKTIQGEQEMTIDVDMELLKEVYKEKKSISMVENINEVWDNREKLLGGILIETIRNRLLNELGFQVDKEDKNGLYKEVHEKTFICFYSDPDDNLYYFGFWSDGNLKGKLKDSLTEILNENHFSGYFSDIIDWDDPKSWLIKQFYIGEYKETLENIADYFIECYSLLEKKLKAIKA
jgi:hypothetical protein